MARDLLSPTLAFALYDPRFAASCVPLALAALTRSGHAWALDLIERASREPSVWSGRVATSRSNLFNGGRGANAFNPRDRAAWLALAGLREVDAIDYTGAPNDLRPTAARFAREHTAGRWLVYTMRGRHVVACERGKLAGSNVGPRQRVRLAVRVENAR